jgi:HAD superfamily hydrolase (TIGR01484 family)
MLALNQFKSQSKIKLLFTDIDDTITDEGTLPAESYAALWRLKEAGIEVVPVTGRPAGWCEMIARLWPVRGVIGENGAFYFCYKNKQMFRSFFTDEVTRLSNQIKLENIKAEVLRHVPGSALASDQFCRLFDLAIDFCEDVPALKKVDVEKIVSIFKKHGAQAKISSIHVNGWYGDYDKLSMAKKFAKDELGWSEVDLKQFCAFSGDSPNDEPMFEFFPHSFAVANINQFIGELTHHPTYVANKKSAHGFVEIVDALLYSKRSIRASQ